MTTIYVMPGQTIKEAYDNIFNDMPYNARSFLSRHWCPDAREYGPGFKSVRSSHPPVVYFTTQSMGRTIWPTSARFA